MQRKDLRLDLACGKNCAPGFEGVDISPCHADVKHVLDLLSFPWPWAAGSVSEIRCAHFIEHIPQGFWTPRRAAPSLGQGVKTQLGAETRSDKGDISLFQRDHRSVDLFMKFFAEAYRVLEPGGTLTVECPQVHNHRAFQDPSHRRFIVPETFFYFSADWRRKSGLEHGPYGVLCDFSFEIDHTFAADVPKEIQYLMRTQEGKRIVAMRDRERWGVTEDLRVTLVKRVTPAVPVADVKAGAPEPGSLDAMIAESNARAEVEEAARAAVDARAKDLARRDHVVAEDGLPPHLFRVSRLPGGVRIDQGNMLFPGDGPRAPEIRAFPDPMPEEMSGAPTPLDRKLLSSERGASS